MVTGYATSTRTRNLIALVFLVVLMPLPALAADISPMQPAPEFFITGINENYQGNSIFSPSNGDGTFGVETSTQQGREFLAVDSDDMDGDGDNDIVAIIGKYIHLLSNDGNGNFIDSAPPIWIGYSPVTQMKIADFNNDGLNDFVVGIGASNYLSLRYIDIYLQDTSGSFTRNRIDARSQFPRLAYLFRALDTGDIDGDGNVDLLVQTIKWGDQLFIFYGDGSGQFSAPSAITWHDRNILPEKFQYVTALALVDVEQDGDLDVVLGGAVFTNTPSNYVLENDGQGTLTVNPEPAFYIPLDSPGCGTAMDSSDFDHDGDTDLIVNAHCEGIVYYVENQGGSFAEPVVVGISSTGKYSYFIGASQPAAATQTPEDILEELIEDVVTAPELTFSNPNQAKALSNKLAAILESLNTIDDTMTAAEKLVIYQAAVDKLRNDILKKTDGFYSGKSKSDWVTTQEGQDYLYPKLIKAIELIQNEIDTLS